MGFYLQSIVNQTDLHKSVRLVLVASELQQQQNIADDEVEQCQGNDAVHHNGCEAVNTTSEQVVIASSSQCLSVSSQIIALPPVSRIHICGVQKC